MSSHRLVSWFAIGSFIAAVSSLGCAPDTSLDPVEDAEDRAEDLSLAFQELDIHKSNAPPGLTIITKKSEFIAHFGFAPPADLSFNSSWLIHYSMGSRNTGGYDANITSVERQGPAGNKQLVVSTEDVEPGPNCFVTMAFTNPQVTVRIPKQKKSIQIAQNGSVEITDCSPVQDFCASALCALGTVCNEYEDACVEQDFCPLAKCANGYVCDEGQDACVGRPCDPDDATSCPAGFACENHIVCITTPCPADYRCEPKAEVTCDDIGWVGTCEGSVLKYCTGDDMTVVDCAPWSCGYSDAYDYYDCQ